MKIISRNKALLLIGIMLVILGQVGVNYLIYKNKNDKSVNKTILDQKNKKDTFAIMLQQDDGTYKSTYNKSFSQSGYMYNSEKSVCVDAKGQTLDNVLSYNAGTNQMALRSSVTAYCYVYFDQMRIKANDLITLASPYDVAYDGTADNNLRYIGANPNNYIYFNCSDYNNPTASTCEKWRIIGAFNNVENAAYAKKTLFKIIRSESLETYSWDVKNNGVGSSSTDNSGSNDWSDSQLMLMLNGVSYNNYKSGYTVSGDYLLDKNNIRIMNISGSYYAGSSRTYIPASTPTSGYSNTSTVDFSNKGLKNDTTRGMIEFVMWKLGGGESLVYDYFLTNYWYDYERGTGVYSGRPTEWAGKVGLMYPSDYGYATSGGTTTNRATCLNKELLFWGSYSDCYNNDWLFLNGSYQWTLTPDSYESYSVYVIDDDVGYTSANNSYVVRPTVYLKSNIEIVGGAGSEANPYTIKES